MKNNKPKSNDGFTNREVAALIEDLRGEFRAVVEVVAPLPERLSAVEDRLAVVENEVRGLKDVVRVAMPSLSSRVSALEAGTGR